MAFKDHFTKQSETYAQFRPDYPDELFIYLARISPSSETAWDCATGNGQAANGLAKYFNKVIASDASAKQIEQAFKRENIIYNVFPAEEADIESSSVDLVTVAQALHWFNFEKFYSEVKRVLKKNGIIAAWSYNLIDVDEYVNKILRKYEFEIIKDYWPPERKFIDQKYETIPFPFDNVKQSEFIMSANWTCEQLAGFLGTWSATQKYKDENKIDPLSLIMTDLVNFWGSEKLKTISWPLILKIGKI